MRARVAVEAAAPFGWDRWIGPDGEFVGMTSFGESGPAPEVYEHFGITADARGRGRARGDGADRSEERRLTMAMATGVNERLAEADRGGRRRSGSTRSGAG